MDKEVKKILKLLSGQENPKPSLKTNDWVEKRDWDDPYTNKKDQFKTFVISSDSKTQEMWEEHSKCDKCGMPCEYHWFLCLLVFECHTKGCERCYNEQNRYNWRKSMLGSYLLVDDVKKLICLDEVYQCRWDCKHVLEKVQPGGAFYV